MKEDYIFIALVVLFFLLLVSTPSYDFKKLNAGIFFHTPDTENLAEWFDQREKEVDVIFFEEGLYGSVIVEGLPNEHRIKDSVTGKIFTIPYNNSFFEDYKVLKINGKIQCGNGKFDTITTTLLAAVPVLFHENPKSVLNIGLGCGLTLDVLDQYPFEKIYSIEIDPVVVKASKEFIGKPSPKSNVIIADARNYLSISEEKYDIIINEPPDPWISTSTYLFSKEFFELMKNHLNKNGIVSQWVPVYEMSVDDFKIFYHTFASVFPYTYGFVSIVKQPDAIAIQNNTVNIARWKETTGELILIGSAQPILDRELVKKQSSKFEIYKSIGIDNIEDFYLFDSGQLKGFAEAVPFNRDDKPILEFSTARRIYNIQPSEVVDNIKEFVR